MSRLFCFGIVVGLLLLACEDESDLQRTPEDAFIKFYGREGNQEGVDVVIGPDNAYYVLGNSNNRENRQIYVVKTDAAGNVLWERTFGGRNEEIAKDIELTPNGQLAIVADTRSAAGDKDIMVLILNADGLRVDSTVYSYSALDEEANSITPINSGYLIAGSTRLFDPDPILSPTGINNILDGIVVRLNADLSPYTGVWGKTLTGIQSPGTAQFGLGTVLTIEKVTQENAGLFVVFSHTNSRDVNSTGLSNAYIFSIDGNGSPGGDRVFGTPEDDEIVTSVARDKLTSGYTVTGISTKPSGRQEVFQFFVGVGGGAITGGNLVEITTNLSQTQADIPISAAVTGFGSGFFLVGSTKNFSADQTTLQGDIFLKLIDRQGGELWRNPPELTFGGAANDFIGNVAETPEQRILLVGTMGIGDVQGQRKIVLIKVNREGKFAP